jgi:hypothetical protein
MSTNEKQRKNNEQKMMKTLKKIEKMMKTM